MRKTKVESWVVYRMTTTVQKKQFESNAVCEQSDWEAMEMLQPGLHTLVQSGIENEAEAEKLARGTSGDPVKRGSKMKLSVETFDPELPAVKRNFAQLHTHNSEES